MALKDEVLTALEARRGESVSGEALSVRLGVSRNAVWKAVSALRAAGYDISSGTNRGYCLSGDCDRLSAAAVTEALGGAALPVYVYEQIDSTSSECRRRIAGGEEQFLVVAEGQTDGRGRRGKQFFSPTGTGLYMSLAMKCDMALADAVGVTAFASVCTARAIEKWTGVSCGIKWVNDLYVGRKKVCGILTEAIAGMESGTVGTVIVGVGINLHRSAVPPELEEIVGFLDCGAVRNRLCGEIAKGLLTYSPADRQFLEEYRARSVVLGREVRYEVNGEVRCGMAETIDDSGALVVCTDSGRDILRGGEISLTGIAGIK